MTESIDKIIELTDEELSEVSGGKEGKKEKPIETNKNCPQCQKMNRVDMGIRLYRLRNYEFCTVGYHIYKDGAYSHSSSSDVERLKNGKRL